MGLQSYGSIDGRFRKIIILAFMKYIIDLDAYELHPGMKKTSMTLLKNASVLHYDKSSLSFKRYICILMLMTKYECNLYIRVFLE